MTPPPLAHRRIIMLVNGAGGTMRNYGVDRIAQEAHDILSPQCGRLDLSVVASGEQFISRLEEAAQSADHDTLMICGGDGSISAGANAAWRNNKLLGVIPGGSMNLYARTLGLPLNPGVALQKLTTANPVRADIATANGRAFIHHFSVGLHARMAHERERFEYRSRIGKILASFRALMQSLSRPPSFACRITTAQTSHRHLSNPQWAFVVVSNNGFGEGHLPYADNIDAGEIIAYAARAEGITHATSMVAELLLNGPAAHDSIQQISSTDGLILDFPHAQHRHRASIDGELIALDKKVEINLHRSALNVLSLQ